jgi:peptidoglycan/LPS O-acetylase OafA/YrhL
MSVEFPVIIQKKLVHFPLFTPKAQFNPRINVVMLGIALIAIVISLAFLLSMLTEKPALAMIACGCGCRWQRTD